MARYIDAELVYKFLQEKVDEIRKRTEPLDGNGELDLPSKLKAVSELFAINDLKYIIESIPTADVRENVHGEWIEETYLSHLYTCSCCQNQVILSNHPLMNHYNFCPNCGAIMDEVTE